MMLLPLIVAAFMMVSEPLQPDFTKVPESILNDGLTTLSVCIATDLVALHKLAELAELQEAEPPPNAKEQKQLIKESAESLLTALTAETRVGSTVIKALRDKYHHSEEELLNTVQQTIAESKDDTETAIGDVLSYNELDEKLSPRLEHCDKSIVSWSTELKKSFPNLENEK